MTPKQVRSISAAGAGKPGWRIAEPDNHPPAGESKRKPREARQR